MDGDEMPCILTVAPAFHDREGEARAKPWDGSFGGQDKRKIANRIARLRQLAWLLDGAMRLPGTRFRFGLNSLVGLTPAAGDAALALVSLCIVYEAYKLGLPNHKLSRMLANVGMEALGGVVPVAGDLFDMTFKANLRNLAIIEEHFGIA